MSTRFAVMFVTLAIAQPLFAQTPQSTARFGVLRQAENPYRKLFTAPAPPKASAVESKPKKTVVCGLTMIEGDSTIDPKMAKTPPKNDGVAHTIRSIEPQVCNP